jgi:hypothetical protein
MSEENFTKMQLDVLVGRGAGRQLPAFLATLGLV